MSRKINFLGVECEVVTEEEMRTAPPGAVYVMPRVDPANDRVTYRHASPGLLARRMKVRCDQCRALCWFDPEGGWLKLPECTDRLCMECMIIRAEAQEKDQS